jgi:hypothetical protein
MELHAQIACAMPRELARKGISWQDRAVYTEAIYYGRENLTDGVIARGELGFWMPDMAVKERTRRLNALRDNGALLDHPAGWQFPDHVWRKWGKLKAEVEAKRAVEAERIRKFRARQRGESEDVQEPYEERTSVHIGTGALPQRVRTDVYATPEPEPEPEPEPSPSPSVLQQATVDPAERGRILDLFKSNGDDPHAAERARRLALAAEEG